MDGKVLAANAKKPWPMVRLGDVCEEIRERIPSSKVSREMYITTDNMLKECRGVHIADSVPQGVGLVNYHRGDILLSNIRPYLKKSWLANRDGGCSSDVIVFRSKRDDLDNEYLFRVLSQDAFFEYSMRNVSGTKMPRGKREWIKQFEFPLPPLPVQRAIVARLEKELGEAEKVATGFRKIAEKAEAEFKAELDETFKAFAEDISRGDAQTRRVRLGDVCEVRAGATHHGIEALDGAYPVYGSGGYICQATQYRCPAGTVTIGRKGTLDNPLLINEPFWNIDTCFGAIPGPMLEARYLHLFCQNFDFYSLIPSIGRPSTTSDSIRDIRIPLPPLSIQRSIVARLDAARECCDKLKSAAQRGFESAENLRKAILKEAFQA